ncbi:MAG: UDP-N-acetylglucosamine 1-carboxyvinyltransferase [Halobacteriovoraceae bacterium]|jgi:UDP-N-acetylglucosamine 1-carboxyvinyltransferase|nr:UDP-N-acetylglucosamine 1-carboxyvinyltransferase [Halobacteriovoraceae bacterium]MBT5092732.1 UDP-N-acetylglucosamine 1-carboxyvinyltransferase [Halobacteriovoraceae bacterium]
MDKLIITGNAKLSGDVEISCAKNAYLPILAGVILNKKNIHLKNLPELRDIRTMKKLLEMLGVKTNVSGDTTTFDSSGMNSFEATYDLVKTMRASIFVLGPLLARHKEAKVSLPGGCAIGTRPIDLHLTNLEKLGAEIKMEGGYVHAKTTGLVGANIVLAFPSVGATENLMMAATLASGQTVIDNAALEPEIGDLGNFLNAMGAKVSGLGTKTLTIDGVKELHEVEYEAIGDRIEAGTYLMAALATNSELVIKKANPGHLEFVIEKLKEMGGQIEVRGEEIFVRPSDLRGTKIDTAPFPGFPTDLQAQMMALLTQVNGNSLISENIFENRFMHVPELQRLGAQITLKANSAFVEGGFPLKAAPIMCTDLRASAALVIAALCAEGETHVQRVYHLDRGYEKLDQKLLRMGVQIKRVNED